MAASTQLDLTIFDPVRIHYDKSFPLVSPVLQIKECKFLLNGKLVILWYIKHKPIDIIPNISFAFYTETKIPLVKRKQRQKALDLKFNTVLVLNLKV